MVKQEPVSVNWQTVFMIIPFVDLWAFYRIEKLRRGLLYFIVIALAIFLPLGYVLFPDEFLALDEEEESDEMSLFGTWFQLVTIGAAMVFVRKWSREWNAKVSGMPSHENT